MIKKKKAFYSYFLVYVVCALFLSACGYQFKQGSSSSYPKTISIPFVEGDKTGDFTAALIQAFSTSGFFEYRQYGGSLTLKVELLDFRDENIGFRYDRNQQGELTKTLIPTESRLCVLSEVAVVDSSTGCILAGPARISANAEFDHDYYFSRDGVNVFSLGQLTDVDSARDAVYQPLNKILAQKIVDFVSNSW